MQAPFSDIYCSPHIDWQRHPAQVDSLSKVECSWEFEGYFHPPCTFGKDNRSIEVDFSQAFGDIELAHFQAQNGLLSWLFDRPMYADHLNSLGLTPDNAFGCLSNFLFQPTAYLQEQLPVHVLKALAEDLVIGIQIR